jgi:hypothetical protein
LTAVVISTGGPANEALLWRLGVGLCGGPLDLVGDVDGTMLMPVQASSGLSFWLRWPPTS